MHPETKERVDRLRMKAAEAGSALSELKAQLVENNDTWVNAHLKLASNWLGDVETFFIYTAEKGEPIPRTAGQEAYWLSYAEHHFETVVMPQIKLIQDAVAKYGPDLQTFPT